MNLPDVIPQPVPSQVSIFNLFEGPKSLPAVDTTQTVEGSPTEVEGSEQSNAELKERVVDLEKKIAELEERAKARGESQE